MFCRRSPVKFWTRIFGYFRRVFGTNLLFFFWTNLFSKWWREPSRSFGRESSRSFGYVVSPSFGGQGKSLGSITSCHSCCPRPRGSCEGAPPRWGWALHQVCGGSISIPAVKTQVLRLPSEESRELRLNSRLSATAPVGSPPSVSLRATAPSEFPRGRGLRPSGGACSPWGPVSRFWARFGFPPFIPLITTLREG